jgi:O-antigen/teichoic acid export membrane protein
MSSAGADAARPVAPEKHTSFFRQSGWLMVANIGGGVMALGVHFLNKKIAPEEYSLFGTLLMVTAFIPTMPLQMLFAQQAARAVVLGQEAQLASMIRRATFAIFSGWGLFAAGVFWFRGPIMNSWEMPSALPLGVTLLAVLVGLLAPMFVGLLQGRQDFLWVGWSALLSAIGRMAVAAVLVLAFGGGATAMLLGALIGLGAGWVIAVWRTRDWWTRAGASFDSRALWRQIGPLMLGFGVCQFMFTTDTMFANAFFTGTEMKCYVAAGTLSRALLWLVLPLAAVMFPKLVQSSARGEKSNLVWWVIAGTAVLAIGAGIGLCVLGPWVVRLVYQPEDVAATTALLPWYTAAMIPLALANVMANDLLAHGRFRAVPVMVLVGLAYAVTLPVLLNRFPGRMEVVLQTLGGFNLLLLAVCVWFTWRGKQSPAPAAPAGAVGA